MRIAGQDGGTGFWERSWYVGLRGILKLHPERANRNWSAAMGARRLDLQRIHAGTQCRAGHNLLSLEPAVVPKTHIRGCRPSAPLVCRVSQIGQDHRGRTKCEPVYRNFGRQGDLRAEDLK